MTKKRDFTFKGKVAHNAEKRERESSFSYLLMPKDFEIYIPDPGRIEFDIVPYIVTDDKHPDRDDEYKEAIVGDPWYCRPFKIHRGVGPDGETVVCLESIGEKCPICEYRKQLSAQGKTDKKTEDEIKELKPKDRILYYIVPIEARDWDEDFHIFDISYHNFQKFLDAELKEDPDYEDFAHPENGRTLHIRWERDSFGGQKFCKANRVDPKPRQHDGYTWEEVEDLPSLDDVILKSLHSYKDIQKMFLGVDGDDDAAQEEFSDPDEKETTSPRKRKRGAGRTRSQETDTEKDDNKDDNKDTPPKRTRSRSSNKDDKDDNKPLERKQRPSTSRRSSSKKDECPYDHDFGKDHDEFEDCENCKLWNECSEAKKNDD